MTSARTICYYSLLIHFFLHFFYSLKILVWADDSSYVPLENIALNCGSSSLKSSSYDGRNWSSDIRSQFVPATADTDSIPAEASFMYPAVPEVPYKTARIFRSQFTYTFDVTPGPKFVRLHFYPSSYLGLNASKAFLSVTALAGRYSLLKNFSASLNADYLNFAYLMREDGHASIKRIPCWIEGFNTCSSPEPGIMLSFPVTSDFDYDLKYRLYDPEQSIIFAAG